MGSPAKTYIRNDPFAGTSCSSATTFASKVRVTVEGGNARPGISLEHLGWNSWDVEECLGLQLSIFWGYATPYPVVNSQADLKTSTNRSLLAPSSPPDFELADGLFCENREAYFASKASRFSATNLRSDSYVSKIERSANPASTRWIFHDRFRAS